MPDKKWERVDKAFTFFRRKAINNEPFTLEELATYTQWKSKTVKTYITKRWSGFLRRDGDQYRCTKAFTTFDQNTFRQHHSQNESVEKFFYQLLVEKAVMAAVSAIEIYNKPDFRFREESFAILKSSFCLEVRWLDYAATMGRVAISARMWWPVWASAKRKS